LRSSTSAVLLVVDGTRFAARFPGCEGSNGNAGKRVYTRCPFHKHTPGLVAMGHSRPSGNPGSENHRIRKLVYAGHDGYEHQIDETEI
jgi:hypothetical protein